MEPRKGDEGKSWEKWGRSWKQKKGSERQKVAEMTCPLQAYNKCQAAVLTGSTLDKEHQNVLKYIYIINLAHPLAPLIFAKPLLGRVLLFNSPISDQQRKPGSIQKKKSVCKQTNK